MRIGTTVFYVLFVVCSAAVLCYYLRSEKPARTSLKGMLSGAVSLLAVHFWGGGAGLYLPLNLFTTAVSLILGAPSVIIMVLAEKFGLI